MERPTLFLTLRRADGIDFAEMAFRKALPRKLPLRNRVILLVTGRLRKLHRMMHNQVPIIIVPVSAREEWADPRTGEEPAGLQSLLNYRFEFPAARAALAVELGTSEEATQEWVQVNVVFLEQLQNTLRLAGSDVPQDWIDYLEPPWPDPAEATAAPRVGRAIASPAVQEALNWLACASGDVDRVELKPIPPAIRQFQNWISGLLGRNLIWAAGEVGSEVPPGVVLMGPDTIRLIGADDSPIVMVAGLTVTPGQHGLRTRFCNALATADSTLAYKSRYQSETDSDSSGRGFARVIVDPITASYLHVTGRGDERKLLLVRRNIWRSWWQEGPTMVTLLIGPIGLALTIPAVNDNVTWWTGLAIAGWTMLVLTQWIARVRRKGGAFRR